jgi:hypothetical protein
MHGPPWPRGPGQGIPRTEPSAQAEEPKNRHDHHDQPDQVDDVVHVVLPLLERKATDVPRGKRPWSRSPSVRVDPAAKASGRFDRWRKKLPHGRPVECALATIIGPHAGAAFDRVRSHAWTRAVLRGMAPAVVGILAVSLFRLAPYALPDAFSIAILAATVTCLLIWRASPSRR